jgi:hypothetical protein
VLKANSTRFTRGPDFNRLTFTLDTTRCKGELRQCLSVAHYLYVWANRGACQARVSRVEITLPLGARPLSAGIVATQGAIALSAAISEGRSLRAVALEDAVAGFGVQGGETQQLLQQLQQAAGADDESSAHERHLLEELGGVMVDGGSDSAAAGDDDAATDPHAGLVLDDDDEPLGGGDARLQQVRR